MLICLTYEQHGRRPGRWPTAVRRADRRPEEVALWITLLLSPVASFMTGAVIPLDGGRSLTVSKNEGATEELLLRVAWFYYKDELTQDEIAKRLSVSRASVGRMLDRARKVGLVSINLNADHLNAFEVSRQLRRVFGLAEALVVPDHAAGEGSRPALNARLGLGGAQFMSTHLRPGGTLGVGWGDTVSRVIAATNFGAVGPVRMVSLTGGVDAYLPAFLSSKGEGAAEGELTSATVIPTPIVASTPELAAALKARAVHPAGAQAGLRRRAGDRRRRHADRGRHHRADGLPGSPGRP